MNTYASSVGRTEDGGLTVEKLKKCLADLELLLPRILYHTSIHMPRLNEEGEPAIYKVNPAACGGVGPEYIILHPDNLPALKARLLGKGRLVDAKGTE